LEAEGFGHEIAGEGFALVPIIAHVAVVKPARTLDTVLGVDQLGLELEELLVGLELRIVLEFTKFTFVAFRSRPSLRRGIVIRRNPPRRPGRAV
jgi:hypothetical protein